MSGVLQQMVVTVLSALLWTGSAEEHVGATPHSTI